jgi:thiamine-monophosphate kinase
MGEFAYINWIRSLLPPEDERVTIGPGDDMAEVALPGGARVLIGTDAILDGTHFDSRKDALADVGWKALAVNLSDAAAMAAVPLAAVGTLALPKDFPMDSARQLFAGLKRCADAYDCRWVGGDITAWDHPLAITVTLLAHAEKPIRRNGARPGQLVCATGSLGGSLLGRHLTFPPRVREAQKLAAAVRLGAMMDLSDGLSSDIGHICDESGVGVVIEAAKVPISEAARKMAARDGRTPLDHALNDGEDFELLFTVEAADTETLRGLDLGVPISVIGRIVGKEQGRVLVDAAGQAVALKPGGYEHWR